jgi:3-oxoadipate enol-lactonase
MFIRLGDEVHHVRLDGPFGSPAVVFLNSLGTDLRIWDGVVERLNGSTRTVRYDMRGHGLTTAATPPYSISDLASDLERIIAALQLSHVTLCGISVGGMVATQVAADRPGQIASLVLCDTGCRIGPADMWTQRIAVVTDRGLTAIADAAIVRWFSERFRAEQPDEAQGYRNMLERCTVAGYTGICAAIRDADLETAARALRCRALVLCGDQDQATPPELNRALAAAIPGAQFELIPGAAHLPCIEDPARLAAHVLEHMGRDRHV